jgi:hypothetical protein
MRSGAIIRVVCVDGPCQGLRHVNHDTGHVLFSDVADGEWCIYKISGDETVDTIAGRYPAAYFDRYDWPHMPGGPLST